MLLNHHCRNSTLIFIFLFSLVIPFSFSVMSGQITPTNSTISYINLTLSDYYTKAEMDSKYTLYNLSPTCFEDEIPRYSMVFDMWYCDAENNSIPNLQQVTDVGATTDNLVYLSGGVETTNIHASGNVTVDGNLSASNIYNKDEVDELVGGINIDLLFHNASSGISTYKIMNKTDEKPKVSFTQTISVSETELGAFISDNASTLAINSLAQGIADAHFHANVSAILGTKAVRGYYNLYVRHLNGSETYISTSESVLVDSTLESEYEAHAIIPNDVSLNISDRILIKLYANLTGTGGNPELSYYIEGSTASRLEIGTTGINFLTTGEANNNYLRLDTANDPLTGDLNMGGYGIGNVSFLDNGGSEITVNDDLNVEGTMTAHFQAGFEEALMTISPFRLTSNYYFFGSDQGQSTLNYNTLRFGDTTNDDKYGSISGNFANFFILSQPDAMLGMRFGAKYNFGGSNLINNIVMDSNSLDFAIDNLNTDPSYINFGYATTSSTFTDAITNIRLDERLLTHDGDAVINYDLTVSDDTTLGTYSDSDIVDINAQTTMYGITKSYYNNYWNEELNEVYYNTFNTNFSDDWDIVEGTGNWSYYEKIPGYGGDSLHLQAGAGNHTVRSKDFNFTGGKIYKISWNSAQARFKIKLENSTSSMDVNTGTDWIYFTNDYPLEITATFTGTNVADLSYLTIEESRDTIYLQSNGKIVVGNTTIKDNNINLIGNITSEGTVCDSNGCIGDNPGIWENVSGTATYNGNVNITGNITSSNSSWGYYNSGDCIVIGDLSYAKDC